MRNQRGGVLLQVIGLSVVTVFVALFLMRQGESLINRGQYRSLVVQRDTQLNSELAYVLSRPNCGIVDLEAGELVSTTKDIYSIKQGLRSDLQGTEQIFTKGSPYIKLTVGEIFIAPFDPKLYSRLYSAASLEGVGLKGAAPSAKEYVPLGSGDNYLATLAVITSLEKVGRSSTLMSSFPVVVNKKGLAIVGCRSLASIIAVREMCDLYGGNWDESSLSCDTQATVAGTGAGEHCDFNDSCYAHEQYKF